MRIFQVIFVAIVVVMPVYITVVAKAKFNRSARVALMSVYALSFVGVMLYNLVLFASRQSDRSSLLCILPLFGGWSLFGLYQAAYWFRVVFNERPDQ